MHISQLSNTYIASIAGCMAHQLQTDKNELTVKSCHASFQKANDQFILTTIIVKLLFTTTNRQKHLTCLLKKLLFTMNAIAAGNSQVKFTFEKTIDLTNSCETVKIEPEKTNICQ